MNVQCPSCETVYRIDPAKVPAGGVRARCAVCSFAIHLSPEVPATAPRVSATVPEPAFFDPPPDESDSQDAVADTVAVAEQAPVAPQGDAPAMAAEPEAEPAVQADGYDAESAPTDDAPSASAPEPAPEAMPETRDLRLSRPFVAPEDETAAPVQHVTRPTAPVFKPTPGAPVQDAPIPPAAAPVAQDAVAPPEDAVVGDITPPTPAPPEPIPSPAPVAPVAEPARPINPFLQRDPKQKARRLARALISDMIVYQPQKRQETLENGTLKEAFAEEIKKSWEEYVDQVGEDMANSTPFFREALNEILAGGQELF